MTSRSLLKENAGFLELIQRVLDPLLVVASGVALYALQFGNLDFPRNYIFVLTGGFLLCLAVFPFFDIYRPYRGASLWAETQTLASAWTAVFAGLVVALFVTKTSTDFSRLWIGQWAIAGFLSLVVSGWRCAAGFAPCGAMGSIFASSLLPARETWGATWRAAWPLRHGPG